ncbi:MAG: M24 family metallopeptidase, partial [Clostridia bacterium]|nr:M24 family metallopeptidase [Clostridia bacterium]
MIVIKSERELRLMREAGKIVADTLHELEGMTSVGVATQELDLFAGQYIMRRGAKPAFKGYRGFPANICTSVNEQVVHGIPGQRRLRS